MRTSIRSISNMVPILLLVASYCNKIPMLLPASNIFIRQTMSVSLMLILVVAISYRYRNPAVRWKPYRKHPPRITHRLKIMIQQSYSGCLTDILRIEGQELTRLFLKEIKCELTQSQMPKTTIWSIKRFFILTM